MESYEEKRNYQRYEHNSPMNLFRMDYQDHSYYAEMNDYSKGGLSMMTNERLVIGQLVYLEMENHNEHTTILDRNKNYSGIVRWSKPYSSITDDTHGRYKYGVEYSGSVSRNC